jgi:predicted RNase H-like HicB family nuclease
MTNMANNRAGFYPVELVQEHVDGAEIWTASHPDLIGCHAVASSAPEAMQRLVEITAEWLERARDQGRRIPEAAQDFTYTIKLDEGHTQDDAVFAERAVMTAVQSPIPTFYLGTPR